jgi:hypothetical protein
LALKETFMSEHDDVGQRREIPTYLAQAILVTLFCCWPLGIPAIVYAAQVNGKLGRGDIAGAEEASRKAKMWCWWSFGLGLVGILFYVAINVMVLSQKH